MFFGDGDYAAYKVLLAEGCAAAGVEIWAWCLMPNHVHLILAPGDEGGLRRALGEAHRGYSRRVNFREGWRGFLWQGRFASVPMDETHLLAAVRYVELNPVRARLTPRAEDWLWSSARAHLAGRDDDVTKVAPLLERVGDWAGFLAQGLDPQRHAAIRAGERTGRPLGGPAFVADIEHRLGRTLARQKPGRKPQAAKEAEWQTD